ncbi:MAG: DUF4377 domain-containing protein [Tannerellaceae bacterium]|nr:DUF4377 domain-containing protein [Tannerellaceae bacterium]
MYRILICLLLTGCFFFITCTTSKNTSRITVASELRDCTGVGPMKCMLVKTGGHNDWIFMYDQIEGFTYEPGYEYVLEVKQEDRPNPAADQSSKKYVLVKVISKTQKISENMPDMPLVR